MFGKKKSKKVPTGNKAYRQGYVSFTPEDIKQQAESDVPNSDAYDLLDQAMFTSSHIKEKDRDDKSVDIDDIYPVTAAEANQMSELLDKAEAVAKDPSEPSFNQRLAELRGIIAWSMQRHWNFQWAIIAGVVVTVMFLRYRANEAAEDVVEAEYTVEVVKGWEKRDTTIAIDKVNAVNYDSRFNNANLYKQYKLHRISANHKSSLEYQARFLQQADTASTKKYKKIYLKAAKESKEDAADYIKEYDKVNKLDFDDIEEMGLENAEEIEDGLTSTAREVKFWSALFLLLIPLYIFAERPYGYTLSRTRSEAAILGGIKKVAFAIAGMLAGGAAGMAYIPDTIVTWSDGSKTTESSAGNFLVMAMKFVMIVAALMLVCVVSCALMLYMTAQGLRRNYNWAPIIAKVKTRVEAAKKK